MASKNQKCRDKAQRGVGRPGRGSTSRQRLNLSPGTVSIFIAVTVLVIIGLAAYINSISGPFVFDDLTAIVNNSHIRQLWPPWAGIRSRLDSAVKGRPVVSFSLAVNYAIGGLDVRGYHIFNIAVHILCTLILFGIVRRTLLSRWLRDRFGRDATVLAWIIAAIWMTHPIQTEAVTYIVQRTELVMALFYLLTLYCAIRSFSSGSRRRWYVIAILSCALGMVSKEVMVTAPVMVLLYDRTFKSGSFGTALRRRGGLYAGLAVSWCILAAMMLLFPRTHTVGLSMGVSAFDYAMNQCIMIIKYLGLVFRPYPLVLDYGFPEKLSVGQVLPYAVVLLALLLITVVTFFRRPLAGFAGIWFFIILSPTSSFVPITTEVGAERRMYLPLAGVVALLVAGGYVLLQRAVPRLSSRIGLPAEMVSERLVRRIAAVLAAAVIAVFIGATVRRNNDYRSTFSIWQKTVAALPDNPRAHNSLGLALKAAGELDEAVDCFQKALKISPDYTDAHNNLGIVMAIQGRSDEAIEHYHRALELDPGYAEANNNLGSVLLARNKTDEAISHFRQALQAKPDDAEAYSNLGYALGRQGRFDEAVRCYEDALKINPNLAGTHSNLGQALTRQGRLDEAIHQYTKALQINPDSADTHNDIAVVLAKLDKLDEAIEHFNEALRIRPDFAVARKNLDAVITQQNKP